MKASALSLFCALGFSAVFAGAVPAGAQSLDVNDVSVLYPLPKDKAESAYMISLKQEGPEAKLLSLKTFNEILKMVNPMQDAKFGTDGELDPAHWHAVALRFDPCGKVLKINECRVQIRLVMQPLSLQRPDFGNLPDTRPLGTGDAKIGMLALDETIHLVYEFPKSQRETLTREFVSLMRTYPSDKTKGQPLGVHPVLLEEGLKGPFAARLKKFVLSHADERHLAGAATMLTLRGGLWRFGAGLKVLGEFVQIPLPTVGFHRNITFTFKKDERGDFTNFVTPLSTAKENVNEIIDSNKPGAGGLSPFEKKFTANQQEEFVEKAIRIENPNYHFFASTDCASCHHASRALFRLKGADFMNTFKRGSFLDANAYVIPEGITGAYKTGPVDGGPYSVRAFGYRGDKFEFVKRTVNESAEVADYINKMLKLK